MRPIELTIKGLHSFREQQTVDFKTLCESGVFGIFGPTGSGKSSLLDAMTLALYGKVERATNQTVAIMNQSENELVVRFTFELGRRKPRRYLVERTLKRSGESRIRTATCRFLDITGEPHVIADKTGDVNKHVELLLGLSIDDFTRAVVLPQGKFAEFLSLRGAERRQMLQRLFHLEQYGDELIRKIKDEKQNLQHRLNELEAEKQGLGDASDERVESLRKELKKQEDQINYLQKQVEQMETKKKETQQIRDWQKEKEQAEAQLQKVKQKQQEIDKKRKQLKKADEATRLLPYLEELEETERMVVREQRKLKEITYEEEILTEKEKQAHQDFEQCREQRTNKEPSLRIKIDRLEQAKAEEEKWMDVQKRYHSLKKSIEEIENKKQQAEKQKNKADMERQQYRKAADRLKRERQDIEERLADKNNVRKVFETKQTVEYLKQRYEEAETTWNKVKSIELEQRNAYEKSTKNLEDARLQMKERFRQLLHWYTRMDQAQRTVDSWLHVLERKVNEGKREMERKNIHSLAQQLRSTLQENEPCPVCGSYDHPSPVEHEKEDDQNLQEQVNLMMTLIDKAKNMSEKLSSEKWKLQTLADQLEELPHVQTAEETAGTNEEHDEHTVLGLNVNIEQLSVSINAFYKKVEKEREAIESLSIKMKKDVQTTRQAKEEATQMEYQYQHAYQQVKENEENKELRLKEWEKEKKKWEESFPHLPYEKIDEMNEKNQHLEESATTLDQRIEKSVPAIEMKEQEMQQLQNDIHAHDLQLSKQKAEINHLEQSLRDRNKHLKALAGENKLEEVLDKETKELNRLIQNEQHSSNILQQISEQFKKVANEKVAASQSVKNLLERYDEIAKTWQEKLESTSFSHHEEVKSSLMSDEKSKEMMEQIKTFENDWTFWQRRIEERKEQLNGRSISESEWEEICDTLKSVQNKRDELREVRGGLVSTLAERVEKNKRFKEIETMLTKCKHSLAEYEKLDAVFRGKGFVEFIAQEQLIQVSRHASERLHELTRGRYAIEVDSNDGFIIRDDANGGIYRPVSSLSGGETFLTSLALALSLSASIQLKGEHPLEFFFLDEGFGTLDQELLDTVITALEKLQMNSLSVGVISHVPELQERLPRKLFVHPAEPGGQGSTVTMDGM